MCGSDNNAVRERLLQDNALSFDKATHWVNSLVIMEKKDRSLRLCPDPKYLNVAIKREYHNPTTAEEISSKLNGMVLFTVIDMTSCYWHKKPDEESSYLCTLNTPYGRYKFNRMPKSGLGYRLTCPRCSACYVGETSRHLRFRVKEHNQRAGSMKSHLSQCSTTSTEENLDILKTSLRGYYYLLTLEALHIRKLKPQINTKDEYKSRELMIKL